jgi:phosphatidylserine/phosphatidylglycerophosphate/cardiolipin synthase-like enzyme
VYISVMDDVILSEGAASELETLTDEPFALAEAELDAGARADDRVDWLIDNAETYGRLLESLRGARRSVHIAQLAFDADCAAYAGGSQSRAPSDDAVLAEILIGLAKESGPDIRILLNASWILNTARPLRKFFAKRGVAPDRIQLRGLSRFPHFMHAKLVLIDGREAFLLGSPFVNSYWDDGGHVPYDARRPLRELGGRPLHDVSVRLHGPVVADLESMFESVWRSSGAREQASPARRSLRAPKTIAARSSGMRVVCDAPDGILPTVRDRAMQMLAELLAGIARARKFIYIEHQYLTSRPIVAALTAALRREAALEIIIVLNQNPDLTAYRGWQNAQLEEHALLTHPRVGVFTLWSTDVHPERPRVTRINQLFIHSKVIIIDDEWAAVGTSNLDGVSMGDYGDDFAGALGRRVFRGVRNVEVNVVIDAGGPSDADDDGASRVRDAESIVTLRERLWHEHLGAVPVRIGERGRRGWLSAWRKAARDNVEVLASLAEERQPGARSAAPRTMNGRLLPYSECAYPREQLADVGVLLDPESLELCYDPTWVGVHLSPHWIRNIF